VSTPFPRHVFQRAANLQDRREARIGNHEDPQTSTFIHLTENFTGKEIFLIGTMNKSTMLATRTKKLIEDVKPEAVYV
jgi:hypothetical protein